jgi:hypothetical protein
MEMGNTRFQTDAMMNWDKFKSYVEKRGSTHPIAIMYPKDGGEPFAIVCEMQSKDELEAICAQLRAVVKEFDIEAVLWIATTGAILENDVTGMLYSVSVFQKEEPTWTYGWTYVRMDGVVEWIEEFSSDTKVISAQVLDLWS